MELILEVPDELEERLRARKTQMAEILELGLAALEDRSPTPEELVAYSRRELDEASREALAERLALDADAVDELLDLEAFDRLEPPSEAHRLGDDDVARALGALKQRIAGEHGAARGEERGAKSAQAAPGTIEDDDAEPRAPSRFPPRQRSFARSLGSSLALAAGLLIAVVGLWPSSETGEGTAVVGHPLQIDTRRSIPSTFTVPAGAETLVLVVEDVAPAAGIEARVRISPLVGEPILEKTLDGVADPESRLLISLPADRLPPGSYRLELLDARGDEPLSEAKTFSIERAEEAF